MEYRRPEAWGLGGVGRRAEGRERERERKKVREINENPSCFALAGSGEAGKQWFII